MKTYRELYFKGTPEQLSIFIVEIGKYATGEWVLQPKTERWKDYLFFEYRGTSVEKANVSIYIGDRNKASELHVGNIVPREKSELSVEEYNAILLKFYDDVIGPFKEHGTELEIMHPSDDIFDPKIIITDNALKKLKIFCNAANKSTGSSHPCDQERWIDFICQTVDDGKMFDYSTLADFLQDESYWGKMPDSFIGVIGSYAWSEEKAHELASEYDSACGILQYYKKSRGV